MSLESQEPELVDEKGLLQPHKVVDYIRNKGDLVIATLEDSLQMLCYDEKTGVWNPDGDNRLKEHVEKMLASSEMLKKQLTVHIMGEIKAHMEWVTYTNREAFQPPSNKICLENGVLYVDEGRFNSSHAAIDGFRNAIPVKYDPLATCPTIEKFLSEVMGDQADLFFEVAGYCLRRARHQAIGIK